jgi:hypothetical protein
LIDAFDMDASQVRKKPIETLLITCPASSPTPDPATVPFPSRNVGQIPNQPVTATSADLRSEVCVLAEQIQRDTGPDLLTKRSFTETPR